MAQEMFLSPSYPEMTEDQGLWPAIRNRTQAIAYDRLAAFIDAVFCGESPPGTSCKEMKPLLDERRTIARIGHGAGGYRALRLATETFLLLNCGVYLNEGVHLDADEHGQVDLPEDRNSPCSTPACANAANLGSDTEDGLLVTDADGNVVDEAARLPQHESTTVSDLIEMLKTYLGGDLTNTLPYLDTVLKKLYEDPDAAENQAGTPLCTGILARRVKCPCLLELIWSYWMESAGLVQSMKAVALRFQNRRTGAGRDPLADLDVDPLRPLGNLIWGYIQEEHEQLTVVRRAYEYDHHYGISLKGKAIPQLRTADSRSKFLAGYHHLLRAAIQYYKAAEDATKIPDGFPLLNALKEVHLALAEGSGNQFGDLPWQARVEMLMEQWLLGRSEMRDFLGGRLMVPYPAVWMGRVDTMRKLQGWGDTSVRYFYDLANFGERLLLSIRYGNWSVATDENQAKNWANYWRQEIQGYIHAYRVVAGVDLSDLRSRSA